MANLKAQDFKHKNSASLRHSSFPGRTGLLAPRPGLAIMAAVNLHLNKSGWPSGNFKSLAEQEVVCMLISQKTIR